MLSAAYQKMMGHPFVYNHVRPLLLGGLDLSPFYRRLEATKNDTILDIGCGTGNALDYLGEFGNYEGFDTDPIAIRAAKQKALSMPHVSFHDAHCTKEDVLRVNPSHVIFCGVLHHLPDDMAVSLLQAAASAPCFSRLFTLDIVYLPGASHWISNGLARLDRGNHVRNPDGYRKLVEDAGLEIRSDDLLWNHPQRHVARYFVTTVCRKEA